MITKIVIVPYFGEFNDYFSLWLESCSKNKGIDWLLITDIENSFVLPKNVKIVKKTFSEVRDLFRSKLGFKISLETPYKLCDYKQFYGFLFEEYIADYDFWGYCDCDLIFGDIESFLTEDCFLSYDKILRTGHLSFVRNKKEINEIFRNYNTYKVALSSPAIYGYDESIEGYHLGFAGELMDKGYNFFRDDELVADIDFRYYPFHIVSSPDKICAFLYDNGKIYRIERTPDKCLLKTEMMYVHLQKRKMVVKCKSDAKKFLIVPNYFLDYDVKLLESDHFWESITQDKRDYFDFRLEKKNAIKRDVVRFWHEPHKIHSLFFRLSTWWRDR